MCATGKPQTPHETLMTSLTPKQEEIAERAYHLYLESGCKHGGDLEHWLRAEKDLGSRFFSPPAGTKPAATEKKEAKKAAPAAAKPAEVPAKPAPTAPAKKAVVKKPAEVPAKKTAAKKKA